MARAREVIPKIAVVLGIGVFCLPILLFLMPVMEESAEELRLLKTYMDVRELSELLQAESPGAPLPSIDPWDQPYQVHAVPDGGVRVLSTGPNRSTTTGSLDEDDIYSDMPESPMRSIIRQKQRQALVALAATATAWIALATWYLQCRA
jgi:hypothetical protein